MADKVAKLPFIVNKLITNQGDPITCEGIKVTALF